MTITLHWWMLPLAALMIGIIVTIAAPPGSGMFDLTPLIWFFVALLFVIAGLGIVVGHFL